MNYIRNLWKGNGTSQGSIPSEFSKFVGQGTLYSLNNNGKPEVIFKSANIKFLFGEDEFCYYLKVENGQTRGRKKANNEQPLFLISDRFKLVSHKDKHNSQDSTAFEWNYEDNKIYGFEFKNRKRDVGLASNFKDMLCRLIFQTKYKIYLTDKIPPKDFLCFCKNKGDVLLQKDQNIMNYDSPYYTPHPEIEAAPTLKPETVKEEKMEVEEQDLKPVSNKPTTQNKKIGIYTRDMNAQKSKSEASAIQNSQQSQSSVYLDEGDKAFIYQKAGDLYQLDEFYQFIKMQENVLLCVRYLDKQSHQMEVYSPKGSLLYVKLIEADTSYFIDIDEQIFKWIDMDDDVLRVLGFRSFEDRMETFNDLKRVLMHECTAEKKLKALDNGIKGTDAMFNSPSSIHCSEVKTNLFAKYDEEFQQKVEMGEDYGWTFADGGKAKYCIIEEEQDEDEEEGHERLIDSDLEDEDDEDMLPYKQIYTYREPMETRNYENNSISQSKLLDRLFVSRGPIISVFKADDSLKFICNLPELTTLDKEPIHPKKLLFYKDDVKMLILNQVLDKKIYSLDLEKGIITNEWVLDGYNSILDMDHFIRNGELSHNDTFIGINNKNIFQFDPNNHDAACINTKVYSSNPRFSCFSTTQQGHFAIGSTTGEVRLFSEVGKNAKNLIPGHGDEIIGVDTTKDGSALASTTENCIYVYRTIAGNANGYLSSMKKLKMEPIKLTIPQEMLMKYNIGEFKFTKAKFDNPYNSDEQFLISTMGRFLVVWKLQEVFENINQPKLYGLKSEILDCGYKDNNSNAIVTILEDEVNYIVI